MTAQPLVALVGAPKCATTALAWSLVHHPEIAFSVPKEPYWFGSDLAPLRARHHFSTHKGYNQMFSGLDRPGVRWRAEASTLYLSSPDALAQLDAAEPDVRVLVSVREPAQVAHAFHQQLVNAGMEPITSFSEAWRAQRDRHHAPPAACPVPRLLQYRDIASLGSQLHRTEEIFGPDRVHVVVHQDLIAEPQATLERLARFLDLGPIPLREPPKANAAGKIRSPRFAELIRSRPARAAIHRARRLMAQERIDRLAEAKDRMLRVPAEREPMSRAITDDVTGELSEQTRLLEARLGRPLSPGRQPG